MLNKDLDLYYKLAKTCSVSGNTEEIALLFLHAAKKLNLQGSIDNIGSSAILIPAKNKIKETYPNIMVTASLDTPGYLVSSINIKEKKITLVKVGNIPYNNDITYILKTKLKKYKITICKKSNIIEAILIDNIKDITSISIGDPIYPETTLLNKPRGKFTSVFTANKAIIIAMIQAINTIVKKQNNNYNLFFVLNEFSNINFNGAITATQKIKPRFIININKHKVKTKNKLSKGIFINKGYLYNKILSSYIEEQAQKYNIPTISIIKPNGVNSEISYMLNQNGGTPICEIDLPYYSLNNIDETISKKDLTLLIKLITELCLNTKVLKSLVAIGGQNEL